MFGTCEETDMRRGERRENGLVGKVGQSMEDLKSRPMMDSTMPL